MGHAYWRANRYLQVKGNQANGGRIYSIGTQPAARSVRTPRLFTHPRVWGSVEVGVNGMNKLLGVAQATVARPEGVHGESILDPDNAHTLVSSTSSTYSEQSPGLSDVQ